MKTNSQIRNDAKSALTGNWGPAILASLVFFLISAAISGTGAAESTPYQWVRSTPLIASILLIGPLAIGYLNSYYNMFINNDTNIIGNAFKQGFNNYWHIVGGWFMYNLFIVLWTCLLIVPGIIMSLAYFAVPFLLVQEPDLSVMEAINKSKAMMKGHKADLFLMCLGFFGMSLVALCTLGILFLWLVPYMYTSYASFFKSIKEEYESTATI